MTNLLTIHVKKITIQTKNMQLLNNLRYNMTRFNMCILLFYKLVFNNNQIMKIIQTRLFINLI
jgi:hypothetical protein